MGLKRADEFRLDAVQIGLTSGLTRKQVAGDFGVGMSTLNKWITAHRDTDVVMSEDNFSLAVGITPCFHCEDSVVCLLVPTFLVTRLQPLRRQPNDTRYNGALR